MSLNFDDEELSGLNYTSLDLQGISFEASDDDLMGFILSWGNVDFRTSDDPVLARPRDKSLDDDEIIPPSSMERDACPIADEPALSTSRVETRGGNVPDKVSPTLPTRVFK